MKKLMRAFRKRGFTLVELLVVIAIIGILVSIILPQINNGLLRARLTAAAANGRSIVQAIVMRSTEGIASSANAWPMYGATLNITNYQFSTSTEFFRYMVTSEWMTVGYNFFTASGVKVNDNPNVMDPINNAWCIVADITDSFPETAPAMFTRNLGGAAATPFTKLDDTLSADARGMVNQVADVQPFGKRGLVVITKGLASHPIGRDQLMLNTFTNEYFRRATIVGTNLNNRVLRPGGTY